MFTVFFVMNDLICDCGISGPNSLVFMFMFNCGFGSVNHTLSVY